MIWTILLCTLTGLVLAATLLSFVRVAHGFFRSFSFPRLQIFAVAVVLLPLIILFVRPMGLMEVTAAADLATIVIQALSILPFTPLWRRQSKAKAASEVGDESVTILSCNVKMSNRDYDATLRMTREGDPDIAVFMETDQPWCDALDSLRETLPHVVAAPEDNAYGMILFSRLSLSDIRIDHLVMDEVPSITVTVTLRDGQRFRLHAVHPEPPVPSVDSVGRDAELLLVADIVSKESLPSVVSGDLNDVAWSHTTRLFQRVSGLLDPRIGRGFYNTFDARFPFLRWPLDHLFHDARFALVDMQRLPAGGSDHFPMLFRLALTPNTAGAAEPQPEDAEDRAEMREIVAESETLDRAAIGVDWEK
ncbi:endonuclease [Aureimonas sp. SA4125]|uniref:endonuclease/exonuclease/phosphatase family protein n=1 Tax=Aureimonas sp. SA4125 TaxID=2826993 RepID=UPI001CC55D0B|nr:endonuclease/exonuclease/phosphatase family protein [Aureimonas sp. SA4125]BDA86648.1 endonuclease [Aureimonas sp. SA4125]